MRLPTRLPAHHPLLKVIAATLIAVLATALAAGTRNTRGLDVPLELLDDAIYDSLYLTRVPEGRADGHVVILAIDDKSLQEVGDGLLAGEKLGWPWPRVAWALLIPYLERCGAKLLAFDLVLSEVSSYQHSMSDDTQLADAVQAAKMPVIFGNYVGRDGKPGRFGPPIKEPAFAAVNYEGGAIFREYIPVHYGMPSLGLRAVASAEGASRGSTERFRVHFYGPTVRRDGSGTFRYVSISRVILAASEYAENGTVSSRLGFDPGVFRDKIVLVGAIAPALLDLKEAPRLRGAQSRAFPGVEFHATAIENMLHGQRVHPVGPAATATYTFVASLLGALGIIFPRRTWMKLFAAAATVALLGLIAVLLFRGGTIIWLPLAVPLVGLVLSTVVAFAWSYLTEGRQRQLVFRALSQAVSPEMATEIERNPDALKLGGTRREMTVMFTDIAGFTDLSETMAVEKLTELMNYYLEEMSSVVLSEQGYVDKYIGDAIMSFWNGPIGQPDHAVRACRTALGMRQRELDMKDELARRGADKLLTRIGINTGPMALGNMGSSLKFSYTVLGDSVNLGSRLESANKLYGSQILMAQTTADLVKDLFVVRQLDLLRVKGKKQPMAVYELMAEGQPDGALRTRAEKYERALALYQKQQWDAAETVLTELTGDFPSDAPALNLIGRIYKLRADPPKPDWDGVYVAKDK
jgi:adenylate cyclase